MEYTADSQIGSLDEVKAFFTHVVAVVGDEWHPDEDYSSYKDAKTKECLFSPEEAAAYNCLQEKCFAVCEAAETDIYDLGWEIVEKWLSANP